jgi:hypothetical protein
MRKHGQLNRSSLLKDKLLIQPQDSILISVLMALQVLHLSADACGHMDGHFDAIYFVR